LLKSVDNNYCPLDINNVGRGGCMFITSACMYLIGSVVCLLSMLILYCPNAVMRVQNYAGSGIKWQSLKVLLRLIRDLFVLFVRQ